MSKLTLKVNGQAVTRDVEPSTLLVDRSRPGADFGSCYYIREMLRPSIVTPSVLPSGRAST